jgi:transposase
VIELYKQGKTRRQIAEIVHMSFKDITDIINEYTGEDKQADKPPKSKDALLLNYFCKANNQLKLR